ncbi:surface-adhesin E family protein [Achromobacter sp. NPDC058515]|uniref:surface-adhesin E family protein n=1 Tax=Achromobacter sp. NPDC058515 TaxID=3346533 RepID=UPI00366A0372
MTARHATPLLALALTAAAAWGSLAQAAAPDWVPVDPQAMPGVFYDNSSIQPVSVRPAVMAVTVAWFYAQPRVSEANGQPYGSVVQPVTLNCSANTYTVTEVQHYAGNDATGAVVESIPVAGISNAPVTRDPVQRKLRELICPGGGKSARK